MTLPDPDQRAKGMTRGVGVADTSGQTWILARAGLERRMDDMRDEIFDEAMLIGEVRVHTVAKVAWMLLMAHYELSMAEAARVCAAIPQADLIDAVDRALFGERESRRSWSDWARSSCLSNGIDPDTIRPDDLPHVLYQLEATGRCIPLAKFAESCKAAEFRVDLIAMAHSQAASRPKPAAPEPSPEPSPQA